jgi:RHS repeat-associated protein
LVWKKFTFSNITTSKIRVVVNASADSVARIAEVEAWTTPTSAATANINWLVTDQLGTPRMVFDQSGSLATTKRHDYAPFGEELLNGARPNTVGYASGDTTRQKFTQKERDNETGLDYFLARYYSSTQGRFTSADPIFISSQQIVNPQSWNLYNYVNNNPLAYLDPTGMERVRLGQHGDEEIDKLRKEKEQQIKQGKKDGTLTNEQEKTLKAERNTLGLEKEGNKLARGLIDKLPASERSGLQVSDFTLTTDPSGEDFMSDSRFAANAGPDPQGLANAAGTKAMFRIRGYSQEIFINTTTTNIKDMMSGDRDWITYGATLVKHEQSHRDKDYNEFQAYTEQKRVLEHFGAGAFSSPEVYQGHLDFINRNIEKNRPKP